MVYTPGVLFTTSGVVYTVMYGISTTSTGVSIQVTLFCAVEVITTLLPLLIAELLLDAATVNCIPRSNFSFSRAVDEEGHTNVRFLFWYNDQCSSSHTMALVLPHSLYQRGFQKGNAGLVLHKG